MIPGSRIGAPQHVDRIGRKFSRALLGHAIYALCSWLILIVLARLGNAASVGRFALALAVATPILLFANLYLSAVQATDTTRNHPFSRYLALRLLTSAGALTLIVAIAVLCRFPPETALLIGIVGLAKAFDAVADIFLGLFQQRERLDLMATTLLINGVLSLTALFSAMAVTQDIHIAALGFAAGSLGAAGWAWIHGARLLRAKGESVWGVWRPNAVRELALQALPLGFTSLRMTLYLSIPRYFIPYVLGDDALGIFATLTTLSLGAGVVVTALCNSTAVQLSHNWAFGDIRCFLRATRRLCVMSVAIGTTQVIGTLFFGKLLLTVLLPPEYAVRTDLLLWLTLIATLLFLVAALESALIAARAAASQIQIHIISSTVLFLSCAGLIPRFGLIGAAWAMGIGTAVALIGNYLALRRSCRQ
jgi:O-antigen/teichoic acid export membrane protein